MGLIGTMYNGISGMGRTGDSLAVLANNIANMNTVAFKASRTTFESLVTQDEGFGQMGSGVLLSSVDTRFAPGNFETSSIATDMAVGGDGFFIVRDPVNTDTDLFTRNGQFKLTGSESDDNLLGLVNQFGYFVQGYNMSEVGLGTGVLDNIIIPRIASPKATENVELAFNLEHNRVPQTTNTTLYESWDGTAIVDNVGAPINNDAFNYESTFQIIDNAGDTFDITIYFDDTSNSNEKEFLVTCNPKLDKRLIDSSGNRFNSGLTTVNKGAGALLYGVMGFNNFGDLSSIDAWDIPADGNVDHLSGTNKIDLSRGEGFYSFTYNFQGTGEDSPVLLNLGQDPLPKSVFSLAGGRKNPPNEQLEYITPQMQWRDVYDSDGNQPSEGDVITFSGSRGNGEIVNYSYTISLSSNVNDLLINLEDQFLSDASLEEGKIVLKDREIGDSLLAVNSLTYSDINGNNPSTNNALAEVFGDQGTPFNFQPEDRFRPSSIPVTNFAKSSVTIFQRQDGYGSGYLKDIAVDQQGFISGVYSNGATIKRAQVALARFTNLGGLTKQGGNLFFAGDEVGLISKGVPDGNGFGSVVGNALEMSNVDVGKEFSNLIITQRVFQANTLSISTADEIYQQLVRLVRL